MIKEWRDEVKPSMKRRMAAIDYSEPGIYMITIATEGRKPLFGKVVADTQSVARMEKSQLGEWVNKEVEQIPRHYPREHHTQKQKLTAQQCQAMNLMAVEIQQGISKE